MRIGITMRTARDAATGEVRDAIDRDWWRFLSIALPGDILFPVANHPASAEAFFRSAALDGLILTGGDDIGSSPERDATEGALLDACAPGDLPVLGICRGLQFLSSKHGAAIVPCDPESHRSKRHGLRLDHDLAPRALRGLTEVNSYHNLSVRLPRDSRLRAWAWSADGCVEGVSLPGTRTLAIGWHPERESTPRPEDIALFRTHFHGETA
ncbi:MAG: gamma-glutamyl-gamma-aminobutyrate hydrolase family protein [Fibrobacterota bacterium]|nr:gamma-glutamyl-gamma-aminobutyrate hydrolase family protein [Fibrobacterota bacterium]QQS07068.1 MAG: gamma-glutamyl-gamma-aminobutyrate hydrolase family protein [Fibrobacterota bacterium]